MRLFGPTAFPVVRHDLSCAAFKALEMHQFEVPTLYHFAVSRPYCVLAVVLTTLADAAKCFLAGARVALSERRITPEAKGRFTKACQYLILMVTAIGVGILMPDYLIELRGRSRLDGVANIERRKAWIKISPQVIAVSRVALGCLGSVAVAYAVYHRLLRANPPLDHQFDQLKQEYSRNLPWACPKPSFYTAPESENDKYLVGHAHSSWYKLVEFAQKYPAFWSELPEHPSSQESLKDWCSTSRWCFLNEKCADPPISTIKPGLETDPIKIQAVWDSTLNAYNSKKEASTPKERCDRWHNKGYPTAEWLELFRFAVQYPSYRPQLPYKGFVDRRDMSWGLESVWKMMCNPR